MKTTTSGTDPAPQYLGTIRGDFDVDSSGGASYSIPLTVPPGRAGLEPSLSVVYNSAGPNGLLGVGFDLRGFSQIIRCAATVAQDGFQGSITCTGSTDRFELDGSRLMVANGTDYMDPNASYRTEVESWQKVTPIYASPPTPGRNGPDGFIVYTKDGRILEYGNTADSQLPMSSEQPSLRTWALNRVTDSCGNYLTLQYTQAPENSETPSTNSVGVLYPLAIQYTGNVSSQGSWGVAFTYEPRTDHYPIFQDGSTAEMKSRLASVSTTYQGEVIRTYTFAYGYGIATGRSQLLSVTEADANGVAKPPSVFDWQDSTSFPLATPTSPPSSEGISFPNQLLAMDYDGNGLVDLVAVSSFNNQLQLSLIASTGTSFVTGNDIVTINPGVAYVPGAVYLPMDIDGNGRMDLLCAYGYGGAQSLTTQIFTSTVSENGTSTLVAGSPSTANTIPWGGKLIPMDVNGDGLVDLVYLWGNDNCLQISIFLSNAAGLNPPTTLSTQIPWFSAAQYVVADFNGDGIMDLAYSYPNSGANTAAIVFLVTTSSLSGINYFQITPFNLGTTENPMSWESGQVLLGLDVNSDGNGDLVQAYISKNNLIVNTILFDGIAFQSPSQQTFQINGLIGGSPLLLPGDVNGTGIPDLLVATWINEPTTGLTLYVTPMLGTGTGFELLPGISIGSSTPQSAILLPMDFNGDGRTELVLGSPLGGNRELSLLTVTPPQPTPFPDLVVGITNGLGGTVEVNYLPLTDPTVYSATGTGSGVNSSGLLNCAIQNSTFNLSTSAANSSTTTGETPCTRLVTFPKYVVTGYQLSDAQGHTYGYQSNYSGGRIDLTGRGWLGFETVESSDLDLGTTQIISYLQDTQAPQFATIGAMSDNQLLRTSDSALLKQTQISYNTQSVLPGIVQLGITDITYNSYTPGNTTPDLTRVVSNLANDAYGNVTSQQDLGDGTGAALYTQSSYQNIDNGTDWVLGLPLEVTTTSDAAGTQILSQQTMTYDPVTNRPTSCSGWDSQSQMMLTTNFGYDAYGNRISTTDPSGAVTSVDYDTVDYAFPITTTFPVSDSNNQPLVTQATYDPRFGVALTQTDANQVETTLALDGLGRVLEVHSLNPEGEDTVIRQIEYGSDSIGVYVQTSNLVGWADQWSWERNYLDGLGRVFKTARLAADGGSTAYVDRTLDSVGRALTESLPYLDGATPLLMTRVFDTMGRQISATEPIDDGTGSTTTTMEWLSCSELTCTEASGTNLARITQYEFGTYGAKQLITKMTAADGGVTTYEYDGLGRMIQGSDPNQVVNTTTLDTLGRSIAMGAATTASGGNSALTLVASNTVRNDAARTVTTTDGGGHAITIVLDALGRTTSRSINGSLAATFDYDLADPQHANGLGRLCRVTETTGRTVDLSYDIFGNITDSTIQTGGNTYTISRQNDSTGRLLSLTFPDGAVQTNNLNAAGQVYSIELTEVGQQTPTTIVEYDQFTALAEPQLATYGNGVTEETTYGPTGLLLSREIIAPSSDPLRNRQLDWNALNQVDTMTDLINGANSCQYTYDPVGRLLRYLLGSGSSTTSGALAYDQGGNITLKDGISFDSIGFRVQSGTISGNRVFEAAYDASGNMTPTWNGVEVPMAFDSERQLQSVQNCTYLYDQSGQRISRTDPSGPSTSYLTPMYETTAFPNGASQNTKYIFGPYGRVAAITEPVGSITPPTTPGVPVPGIQYEHHDHLGSTVMLTDSTGASMASIEYLPHGEFNIASGTDCCRYKYTGKEFDQESGFYYFDARYYDPRQGRFITADNQLGGPLYSSDVFHRYAYVLNNPMIYVDPTGHSVGSTRRPPNWFQHHWQAMVQFAADAALIGLGVAVLSMTFTGYGAPIATIVGGALLGAGLAGLTSNIFTAATHQKFGWTKWGIQLAVGAVGGAISGGATAASIKAASYLFVEGVQTWGSVLFSVGTSTVGNGLSNLGAGVVNDLMVNPHDLWTSKAWISIGISTGVGAAGGFVSGAFGEIITGLKANALAVDQKQWDDELPGKISELKQTKSDAFDEARQSGVSSKDARAYAQEVYKINSRQLGASQPTAAMQSKLWNVGGFINSKLLWSEVDNLISPSVPKVRPMASYGS